VRGQRGAIAVSQGEAAAELIEAVLARTIVAVARVLGAKAVVDAAASEQQQAGAAGCQAQPRPEPVPIPHGSLWIQKRAHGKRPRRRQMVLTL
jgi:hypothetical protein